LSISQEELGEIIGISKSAVSRAASGGSLPEDGKAAELAALFVRMFRALDAIVGGDENVAAKWVRNHNTALGGEPLVIMKSLPGLVDCLAYLDARRALF
jgi:transcriptional regulator with XRE-family HTH domain